MKVTLGEFIDNMEKNGYPQGRFAFVLLNYDGEVIAACALGQGLLNTFGLEKIKPFVGSYNPNEARKALMGFPVGFIGKVMYLNDSVRAPISDIVSMARLKYADALSKVIFED